MVHPEMNFKIRYVPFWDKRNNFLLTVKTVEVSKIKKDVLGNIKWSHEKGRVTKKIENILNKKSFLKNWAVYKENL